MSNQWPEFDQVPQHKTVRGVLIEEGSGIAERTHNEIRFIVESEPLGTGGSTHGSGRGSRATGGPSQVSGRGSRSSAIDEAESFGGDGFLHRCFLFVPKVGYRYSLMQVVQEGLSYPVAVLADIFPQGTSAENEAEFRKILGRVFQSEVVKNLVPQLLELVA